MAQILHTYCSVSSKAMQRIPPKKKFFLISLPCILQKIRKPLNFRAIFSNCKKTLTLWDMYFVSMNKHYAISQWAKNGKIVQYLLCLYSTQRLSSTFFEIFSPLHSRPLSSCSIGKNIKMNEANSAASLN